MAPRPDVDSTRAQRATTEEPVRPTGWPGRLSSWRALAITTGALFLSEIVAMRVLEIVRPEQFLLKSLLDAAITTVLLFPILYVLAFRPLM